MALDLEQVAEALDVDVKVVRRRYDLWRRGRRQASEGKVSLELLACLAGVSPSSVSNFLNKKRGSLSQAKAVALQRLIACVGYVPSSAAKMLGKIKKMEIGFVAPITTSASLDFYIEILKGVKEHAGSYGYGIDIYDVSTDQEQRFYAKMPFLGLVDGLVSVSSTLSPGDLAALGAKGIPVVQVNPRARVAQSPVTHTLISDTQGFETLVTHLLRDHGCRAPVIISTDPSQYYQRQDLLATFARCLEEQGVAFDPQRQVHIVASYSIPDGRGCLSRARAAFARADSFVCLSDVTATAVAAECAKVGLRVPVTGYANMPMASLFDLTTIDQNLPELGKAAFEKMFFALGYREVNGSLPEHVEIDYPSRFVKRHSCGCP